MDIAAVYDAITSAIQNETGASDSLLHVHAGMAVLLAARLVTGKSLATPIPFLVVCIVAAINEAFDRVNNIVWRPTDSVLDLVNTLFWPFVLMIGLRLRRSRQQRQRSQPADAG